MFWFFDCEACGILAPNQGSNHTSCIGRQSLNHWTTREVPDNTLLKSEGAPDCVQWWVRQCFRSEFRSPVSTSLFQFFYFRKHFICAVLCHSVMSDFMTLWTVSLQASLSVGFCRQESWRELLCPPPGDLPNPGIKPSSLALQEIKRDSLQSEPPGKPKHFLPSIKSFLFKVSRVVSVLC